MNKLKHFDRTIKELLTIFKSVTMFYTGLYKGQFTIYRFKGVSQFSYSLLVCIIVKLSTHLLHIHHYSTIQK